MANSADVEVGMIVPVVGVAVINVSVVKVCVTGGTLAFNTTADDGVKVGNGVRLARSVGLLIMVTAAVDVGRISNVAGTGVALLQPLITNKTRPSMPNLRVDNIATPIQSLQAACSKYRTQRG